VAHVQNGSRFEKGGDFGTTASKSSKGTDGNWSRGTVESTTKRKPLDIRCRKKNGGGEKRSKAAGVKYWGTVYRRMGRTIGTGFRGEGAFNDCDQKDGWEGGEKSGEMVGTAQPNLETGGSQGNEAGKVLRIQ